MSNHEQDLLSQAMRDRAAGIGGHPLDLDSVRGRAASIRRRRNAVRGAVAAVVAAVAVPSGLAVTSAFDSPGGDVPPPVASPSVTKPATPRPGGTVRLTLDGLPQGEPSKLAYVLVEERQLVGPEGTRELPEAYSMMLPYNDGWVALASGADGHDLVMLDADLRETSRQPSAADTIVSSADGSQVAWAVEESPGTLTLFNAPANGLDPVAWQLEGERDGLMRPVGFLDHDTVVVQSGGESNEVSVATVGGEVTPLAGFLDVSDASEANGLVAGRTSYDPTAPDSCSGVKAPGEAEMRWESCDLWLGKFSPDGAFVTGYPGYFDFAAPELRILDADTGETVLELAPEEGLERVVGVQQVAWEDEDSLLAVVVDGDQQALVRVSLDGTLEQVTEPMSFEMDMRVWVASETRS